MSAIPPLKDSDFPEDALRFFHGLSNWVENIKGMKLNLISWQNGQKRMTLLNSIKPKLKDPFIVPSTIPEKTLYVPLQSSGLYVIRQLRHAFCHDNLEYDYQTGQYVIKLSDKMKIAGRFSLEAIREFVEIYSQSKEK